MKFQSELLYGMELKNEPTIADRIAEESSRMLSRKILDAVCDYEPHIVKMNAPSFEDDPIHYAVRCRQSIEIKDVVMCKDCRFCINTAYCSGKVFYTCYNGDGLGRITENSFCCYGEPKHEDSGEG